MSKKYKIIIGLVFFFIFIAGLALQIDDDIAPEVQEMYQQVTTHKESEAYVYLLGLQANANEDPKIVGQQLLKSLRKSEQSYSIEGCKKVVKFEEYPDDKRLPPLKLGSCSNALCETVDILFSHKFDSDNIPEEQQILLKRYRKFLSFKDFHSLEILHLESPIPPFKYIIDGSNLVNLIAIDKAKKQHFAESTQILLENISALRPHLIQADTLIQKLIYTAALSRSLDVLSILRNKHKNFYKAVIKPLNKDERNLVKSMAYENIMLYNISKNMANCPNYIYNNFQIPEWLYKTVYKPNITINSLHTMYKKVARNSLVTSEEFTKKTSKEKPSKFRKYKIRNLLGSAAIYNNSQADFHRFVARVFALDAKIQLFNETASLASSPKDIIKIKNPFYPSEKTAYLNKDKKSVCFDVPTLTRERDRCLRIK